MSLPRIFATGGAHIDRRGQLAGPYIPASSNPGRMREDVGGGTFNALRTAVRRGAAASLMSIRGGDAAGETVARTIQQAGIEDLSSVFLDRATPSYTALIDRDGELIVGFADMDIYDLAFPKQMGRSKVREAVSQADAVLCDANLPSSALERLAAAAGSRPVFAIAVSAAKVVRLKPVLGKLAFVFMNRREAEALVGTGEPAGVIAALRAAGLASGVITGGAEGVIGFDGDQAFSIAPPVPQRVIDVTGAGDALAGATVAALLRAVALRDALREGVAAAMLAVESLQAVPSFTQAAFAKALNRVPLPQDI
jgi:pseudouridine kinase